jgi:hypothetical protein
VTEIFISRVTLVDGLVGVEPTNVSQGSGAWSGSRSWVPATSDGPHGPPTRVTLETLLALWRLMLKSQLGVRLMPLGELVRLLGVDLRDFTSIVVTILLLGMGKSCVAPIKPEPNILLLFAFEVAVGIYEIVAVIATAAKEEASSFATVANFGVEAEGALAASGRSKWGPRFGSTGNRVFRTCSGINREFTSVKVAKAWLAVLEHCRRSHFRAVFEFAPAETEMRSAQYSCSWMLLMCCTARTSFQSRRRRVLY